MSVGVQPFCKRGRPCSRECCSQCRSAPSNRLHASPWPACCCASFALLCRFSRPPTFHHAPLCRPLHSDDFLMSAMKRVTDSDGSADDWLCTLGERNFLPSLMRSPVSFDATHAQRAAEAPGFLPNSHSAICHMSAPCSSLTLLSLSLSLLAPSFVRDLPACSLAQTC